MHIAYANRYRNIPTYLFAGLEQKIAQLKAQGIDVINLSIGDPDLPTPEFIRQKLEEEVLKTENHRYPESMGQKDFRQAVTTWMKKRFSVDVDADREVNNLIGSKEGLANIARAFVNPGERVLCPDPAYSVYAQGATLLCDGVPVRMPLLEENNFLPDFENIPTEELKKSKLLFLNYPNNPTGATAPDSFLKEAVDFCLQHNLILVYDNAYSEFYFDGVKTRSILEFERARECAIELHSLSKTFCMTGDRVGFAIGNEKLIAGLRKIKSNTDTGTPIYIQKAAIAALESYPNAQRPAEVENIMTEYATRRDAFHQALLENGFDRAKKPPATLYYWLRLPKTYERNCAGFAQAALQQGVICTAGTGLGQNGEGYVRFSLTQPADRLREAAGRLKQLAN